MPGFDFVNVRSRAFFIQIVLSNYAILPCPAFLAQKASQKLSTICFIMHAQLFEIHPRMTSNCTCGKYGRFMVPIELSTLNWRGKNESFLIWYINKFNVWWPFKPFRQTIRPRNENWLKKERFTIPMKFCSQMLNITYKLK